ncbi:TonB-dependent receptor [Mangrovimonas sp. ST2L15]|uniref:SusC/RagA family TonB-linked outer membrane protein n=1 Tax=Mangrovimonas sp. ST2L15 TaxID=1645916 RepID=UPI0006B4F90B|nr:TonB-dependent receptor [Mangrovimonas sp. ST2L15]
MRSKFYESTRFFTFFAVVFFFVLGSQTGFAQENITVSGTVTDASDGMPVPGASVILRGDQTKGTSTDFDGNFVLEVPSNAVLQVSYIGYSTLDVEVNGQTTLTIQIEANIEALGEVVVIGYGVQKKDLTTGANLQVDGEALQKQSTTNALQAMQGQAAGVQITSTSGQPGSSLNVAIRGLGTIGNNSPLYVVDGVLTNDISYLNNADIETISVLKDAASSAIYGSQAANGVILVTTKKGKKGKAQITFDQFYGIQTLAKKMDLLNSYEYMTIMNEASINSGQARIFSDNQIANAGTGTDWLDEMFQDATTENYSVGISGGSDTSSYSSSLSYLNQEGIVGGKDNSYYERYNFRFNSEHKLYDGRITFGENFSYAWINNNGIGVGGQYNNSLRSAFQVNPLVPMYDTDGNYYNTNGQSDPWLNGVSNPYANMVYNNQNENDGQKLIGNVYFNFELLKGLNFRTSLGLDYYANQGHSFTPIYELSTYNFSDYRRVSQYMNKGKTLIWDNTLTYDFDLAEDHNFSVMAGTSAFNYEGHYMSGSNIDLVFNDLEHAWLDNATNNDGSFIGLSGGPNNIDKRMSYFGRLSYDYKGKLLLNATYRVDGSSRFADGYRWGYFPSFSAGWVVTKEEFLQDKADWLSFFKLRGSWGQVGNQNVDAFQYMSRIQINNTNYIFGNEEGAAALVPGAYPVNLANETLQWETAEEVDFGFDARLFDSKLSVNFDWYRREQKDWLIRAPILDTAGVDEAPWINGGSVVNSGVELAISFNNAVSDDFSYNFSVNGSYNKNEVGSIPNRNGIIEGGDNSLWANNLFFYRAQDGMPLGYYYGYETAGVFQTEQDVQNYVSSDGTVIMPNAEPGDLIFVDNNGDGMISDADKTKIGDPNPDFVYGFSLGANYKAFDFNVQANGVAGNQILQSYRDQSNGYQNWSSEILDRWHGPGSSNSLPRVTLDNRNYNRISDIYVKDGDFLRISTVTLGFDVAKAVKSQSFFVDQLRIYASVLNLYTFTNYNGMDPEVGYGEGFSRGVDVGYYPRPRTYMVGLNVKF